MAPRHRFLHTGERGHPGLLREGRGGWGSEGLLVSDSYRKDRDKRLACIYTALRRGGGGDITEVVVLRSKKGGVVCVCVIAL